MMTFPTFSFASDSTGHVSQLFPTEIEADDWVAFHGTSGFNASSIEQYGFDPSRCPIASAAIQRVTSLFERIKWCGVDHGGYAALKPFSLDYDYKVPGESLLFFAVASSKALTYATRDFSGGEKLRSLRRSINDLYSYINDPYVRAQHIELMEHEYNQLIALNAHPTVIDDARPIDIDLDWLRHEITELDGIRCIANEAFSLHKFGVVYAVRFTDNDVDRLSWNQFMGLEVASRTSPTNIVGKVVVPIDFEKDFFNTGRNPRHKRFNSGLLAAIKNRDNREKS